MEQNKIIEKIDELIKKSHLHFDGYDFDGTLKIIYEAINLARENNLTQKLVETLGELGYYQVKEIGNIDLARECYLECIELLKIIEDNQLIASNYRLLGNTYYSDEPDRQTELYEKALKYHSFDDCWITKSRIYGSLGFAYLRIGNLELSRDNYLIALDVYLNLVTKQKNEKLYSHILRQLGNVYSQLGEEVKAQEFQRRYEKTLNEAY